MAEQSDHKLCAAFSPRKLPVSRIRYGGMTDLNQGPTLLEDRRMRNGEPRPVAQVLGPSKSFQERQEALLLKQGRGNATPATRKAVAMENEELDEGRSTGGSVASRAPSHHPSVQSSVGLSEATLGAGDDTAYWDFQHRQVEKKDLGHKCHECKDAFRKLGAALTERRGGRVSMRYHGECFSGFADPRSQARSSHHEGKLRGTQLEAAPVQMTTKMRTAKHFEAGGRVASSLGGKFGTLMSMGHNSFGSKSSKGKVHVPQRAPGDLTEDQLALHEAQLKAIAEETAQ
ncbi:unnamed protein product [Effrenium voratum]|nr:unnamed protein product [Effrenium voratum]